MRLFFYLIPLIVSFSTTAQIDRKQSPLKAAESYPDILTLDVLYGNVFYQKTSNRNFNSFQHSKIGQPLQTIGLSITYSMSEDLVSHKYSTHVSYSQIIPQQLSINDSLLGRINGGIFSFNIFGYDFTSKSKVSSVILGGGFNAGRLRVSADDYRSLKNPYFAPAVFFNPRFLIKRLAISFRAEYQFDVSKKRWKSMVFSQKGSSFELENLNQSGLILHLSLGWRF
jgi:hypothetical protein